MTVRTGRVLLVGAGPGAHDLITLRGLECLRRADVVLYDELAHRSLLEEAPESAEKVYVGKRQGEKTLEQDAICRLMVQHARAGHQVVRLKGGDPFVFGRGAEEAEALVSEGIPFEIVPGVTSAVAVPAFAGIPLTHRDLADGFEVWTGHNPSVLRGKTAVVLMGVRRLAENVARLREAGYAGETPAAVIHRGTLARQRTVVATLETMVQAAAGIDSPAILVVGEVVALRERLRWFETRPLFGHRVLVTRSRAQGAETCRVLEELGAETVTMPTIAFRPPADPEPLRRAVRSLGAYDYLVLTSANAADPLQRAVAEAGLDARAFAGLTICAIGPGTAKALACLGLRADIVPADHRAEGLLDALPAEALRNKRVLLPRAAVAREILPAVLAERGAQVDLVPAYETVLPDPELTRFGLEELDQGAVDTLTFTSASTVENFAAIVGPDLRRLCAGKTIVAIGPVTADACRALGLEVQVMPKTYTLAAMVEELVAYFGRTA
jgi:uroporphyrinogen III methyltransferase/synthase